MKTFAAPQGGPSHEVRHSTSHQTTAWCGVVMQYRHWPDQRPADCKACAAKRKRLEAKP